MSRAHNDTKCRCGKFGHISESQAKKAARRVTDSRSDFEVYRCNREPYWHWTSKVAKHNTRVGIFDPGPVRVKKVEFFPGKPWTVFNRDGVIVSSHAQWRSALNNAFNVAKTN